MPAEPDGKSCRLPHHQRVEGARGVEGWERLVGAASDIRRRTPLWGIAGTIGPRCLARIRSDRARRRRRRLEPAAEAGHGSPELGCRAATLQVPRDHDCRVVQDGVHHRALLLAADEHLTHSAVGVETSPAGLGAGPVSGSLRVLCTVPVTMVISFSTLSGV